MFFGYIDPGSGVTIIGLGGGLVALLGGFLGFFLVFFKKITAYLKKRKRIVLLLIILGMVIGVIIIGVTMFAKKTEFSKKVVVLGFDGLSPDIMEPMMIDGRLPNFLRLKNRGSYRRLATTNPPQSPVAWSAFATGQNPGINGVFDFIIRDPKTYGLRLSLSNVVKGKPKRVVRTNSFWNYTSMKDIPTVVITCPVTFPPDKIKGRMLSGMGVTDILGTEGTFTFYTSEKLKNKNAIGGKVFTVRKSPVMTLNLIGPRVSGIRGISRSVNVPVKVTRQKNSDSVLIEYQGNRLELPCGKWSGWNEVTFNLGFLRKAKGIFKFYLIETEPEFKLYISPINYDPREPFFRITHPKNYSRELANAIGLYHTQGMPIDTWAVNEKRLTEEPFLEQVNEVLQEKRAMLNFELSRLENGLLFCYFESPDIIQHMFWRYADPAHPQYEIDAPKKYKEIIKTWYVNMDDILGGVMQGLSENDVLIVLSDHGFNTFRRTVHLNSWLRQNGYLELKEETAKSGGELLVDIDWSKTKAYAIGFGAIYINRRGREGSGIVNPGAEVQQLKEEISSKLKTWKDEKNNGTIVHNVFSREDIFWGTYAHGAPDLYVGFNAGYRASWQTALGGVPAELVEDNLKKWSGSHLFDPELVPGILFTNFGISKKKASIYDMAPTILKACGFDEKEIKAMEMDGESIF